MHMPPWRVCRGEGALVAAAIHEGTAVREELASLLAVDPRTRRREEDPFTGAWTTIAPTRIVGCRSRFEVDLNRPPQKAVYLAPEDAWGLTVWREAPSEALIEGSRALHRDFFAAAGELLSEQARNHGRVVVFDLHSYNHRRGGPGAPFDPPEANPEINVGTRGLDERRWGRVVAAFMEAVEDFDFEAAVKAAERRVEEDLSFSVGQWRGARGRLDIRRDKRFRGGYFPAWINETFGASACALAIEVKKIFMDEWTGRLDEALHQAIGEALAAGARRVAEELAIL